MKVLVQDMPRMLRDIVEGAISTQPDMELVEVATVVAPPAQRDEPDVAVVGTKNPDDSTVPAELLARWPRSRIVMVAISGPDAMMYALRPIKTQLGEMSPTRLVEAIRFAFSWTGAG